MVERLKQKLTKGVNEIPIELSRIFRKKYPSFVTAYNVRRLSQEVPVFMFHTVYTSVFEEQLEFLKTNGYRTLTIDAFLEFLHGKAKPKEPSVLLTFDDGDISWYQVAYPLLKKFNFHAIGFIVPFYIEKEPHESAPSRWLSWAELIEMDQSKVFDIQSHTYRHDNIFVGPELVDFFHPQFDSNLLKLNVPWIKEDRCFTNQLKLGTPIYRYAYRFSGQPRYHDDLNVRQACISWVEAQGGENFFCDSTWRKKLRNHYQRVCKTGCEAQYDGLGEQKKRILEDLKKAKITLEEKLTKRVEHLCYPGGAGSDLSVELSKKAGYASNFWVTLNDQHQRQHAQSPYYVTRLKDDYIFRLPGKGRKSLLAIAKMKLSRRMKATDIYS